MNNPLGKYAEQVAATVSVLLVAVAVIVHGFMALGLTGAGDTAWLDNAAFVAVGVIFGARAATNGAARVANAAHARLDALGAPPASEAGKG